MCGIAGYIDLKNGSHEWRECLRRMTASLAHRGPDDEGEWFDAEAGVALGQRRLSIVDLSPEGHQPMQSAHGRYQLVFNGEVYNFRSLRKELETLGHKFRGHSDTEVMLAAFEEWELRAALQKFTGMFAFALWDRTERVLSLVRDRLGEKPLYYGWMNGVFLFGSELKALRAHSSWRGEIDRDAVALLMRHNCVPAPHSIYKGIYKLPPGTILSVPLTDAASKGGHTPAVYWSAREVAEAGVADPFRGSEGEAVEHLDRLLRDSISQQMVADVPLGAFLSGGIDSSVVVALMQALSNQPVRTFTIGFDEEGYNEAVHAKDVAKHLGTAHTELYLRSEDAMAVIPKLATIYDEPFSDSSQIPTFLVSQLARRHVTVSLSGDGGDELFCGYTRYTAGSEIWNKISRLPHAPRSGVASVFRGVPVNAWDSLFGWAAPLLSRYGRPGSIGDKLHKAAEILDVPTSEEMYRRLVSHWKETSELVPHSKELSTALTDSKYTHGISDFTQRMMLLDTVSYLPDDILVKVDRASMAVSLEARVPFLDHRVVEFAWRVPMTMKMRDGQGKWLLRQVLYRYVPRELIDRPKMGFGVPIDKWLRGPLREWAQSLLDERRLHEGGFFNPAPILQKWTEHLSGSRNWQYYLWDVLMFQAWLDEQKNTSPEARCDLAQSSSGSWQEREQALTGAGV